MRSINEQSRFGGYFALFLTSTIWGTTWVAAKFGVEVMPALHLSSIRQLIGGLLYVAFFLFIKKFKLPTRKQFVWLFVMSLLMFVSANGLSTWSISFIPSGLGALIGALYPLCVVLIETLFFKSKGMRPLTFIGLILGILGIGVVFYEHIFHTGEENFMFGIILALIAMLSWSVGTVFIARNKTEIDPYYGIGWQMFLGGIMLYIITFISGDRIPETEIPEQAWWSIAYLVVLGSLVAFAAFIYSMKKLNTSLASLYAYINPIIAMLLGAVLLGEKLSAYILWGSLITIAGVFLVNWSMREKPPIAEPEQ